VSEQEIDEMLNGLNLTAKKVNPYEYGLPLYGLELTALQSVVRKHLQPQPIPLPTVPVGATCGGCRWWHPVSSRHHCGHCYSEPQVHTRLIDNPACRRYQEAAK